MEEQFLLWKATRSIPLHKNQRRNPALEAEQGTSRHQKDASRQEQGASRQGVSRQCTSKIYQLQGASRLHS